MGIKELIDYCQAEAVASKLHPTEESLWRLFCREYSKTFHTPLHLVLEMPPEEVLLHVYEERMDSDAWDEDTDEGLQRILDLISMLEDPEYVSVQAKELEDFIEEAERLENERIEQGKPIHPGLRYESETKRPEPPLNAPKSGGINLSYLEKEENER